MIDLFLSNGGKLGHLRSGPLGPHIDGFAKLLASQGHAVQTRQLKIRLVADLSAWLRRKQLPIQDLDETQAAEFLKTRKQRYVARRGERRTTAALLRHFRHLGIIPGPHEAVNDNPLEQITRDYAQFLSEQRGVSQTTIDNYLPIVRRFLGKRFEKGKVYPEKLCIGDVTRFIVRHCSVVWPGRVQLATSVLRSFLGFLAQTGKINTNLAAAVPSVAKWRLAELPQFLEPAQVEKLLNRCDQSSPIGRRDYAVLLLLARLGLRAGEVVHLDLENIDWVAGEVLIRGKSAREARLPLLPEVGRALAQYLKRDRPVCACRRVFIRMRAPRLGFFGLRSH